MFACLRFGDTPTTRRSHPEWRAPAAPDVFEWLDGRENKRTCKPAATRCPPARYTRSRNHPCKVARSYKPRPKSPATSTTPPPVAPRKKTEKQRNSDK